MFFPDFLKALAFAVVIAENMNGIILSQPAMNLGEKFPALLLGDLRFGRTLSQRTKSVKTFKLRIADCGLRIGFVGFDQFNRSKVTPVHLGEKIRP